MGEYDFGVDIQVLPDLNLYETLVEGIDCLIQDLQLRLDNPRGLVDGTEEGESWGFDLRGFLNAGFTPNRTLELVVNVELELEKDDRVSRAKVRDVDWNAALYQLKFFIEVETLLGPFLLSLLITKENLSLVRI